METSRVLRGSLYLDHATNGSSVGMNLGEKEGIPSSRMRPKMPPTAKDYDCAAKRKHCFIQPNLRFRRM